MVALPFAVSLVLAIGLAPALLSALRRAGCTATNHRGRRVPSPAGLLVAVVPALGLAAVALTMGGTVPRGSIETLIFVSGVALLGLLDDRAGAGERAPRGVRAHLARTLRGRPSTGSVKALGTASLAVAVVFGPGSGLAGSSIDDALLATATLTLLPHVFNLLDLRPGRSLKALALLGAGLTFGDHDLDPLWRLGAPLAPLLVLLPLDLRERGMLGDTGASAAGAVAGLWIVLALSPLGQAIALGTAAAFAAYGELRSVTALVERSPLLRQLDSLGRCG